MVKKNIDKDAKKFLVKAIQKIKDEDVLDFLESLLSSAEIKDISRRLMAAKLLAKGITYEEIGEDMGMSSGTTNKIRFKTKGSPALKKLFKKDWCHTAILRSMEVAGESVEKYGEKCYNELRFGIEFLRFNL